MIRTIPLLVLLLTCRPSYAQVHPAKPAADTPVRQVFRYIEHMPEAPYDVNGYISEHLNYPYEAMSAGVGRKVVVQFIVDTEGQIKDARIVGGRHLGYGLEEEALRVVRSFPKWKPGRHKGVLIDVYYTLPVVFTLNK